MTGMKSKFQLKFQFRLDSLPATGRNFSGILNLDSISSPVSNPLTVCILCTHFTMNPEWEVHVIDVEGAFLQGKFQNGEEMYMEVPDKRELDGS
jgi:hypothetical protein